MQKKGKLEILSGQWKKVKKKRGGMAPTKSVIFAPFAKFVKIVNFAKNWKITKIGKNWKICWNSIKQWKRRYTASSGFSLQVWLLALQSHLHLLLVTYKQTNYTTLRSTCTCNTNDFVNAESHTSKRETSAFRVKRRLRGSWLNLRFMRKL